MTIEQAAKVQKSKTCESGMIIDPVTLPLTSTVADAKMRWRNLVLRYSIVDENQILKGIVTNRDCVLKKQYKTSRGND
jgi:IMP dehydrogenase